MLSAILHHLRHHHRTDQARRRRPVCRCGRDHPGPRHLCRTRVTPAPAAG
ncbi:hypothetical protein RB201_04455 [Streptomyces sp. S1A(2023)]